MLIFFISNTPTSNILRLLELLEEKNYYLNNDWLIIKNFSPTLLSILKDYTFSKLKIIPIAFVIGSSYVPIKGSFFSNFFKNTDNTQLLIYKNLEFLKDPKSIQIISESTIHTNKIISYINAYNKSTS